MPYLLLGNSSGARNEDLLRERKVKTVFNVANDVVIAESFYVDLGIERLWIKAADSPTYPLKPHIPEVVSAVKAAKVRHEKTGETLFIHCAAGVSRSATLVIAALMLLFRYFFTPPTAPLSLPLGRRSPPKSFLHPPSLSPVHAFLLLHLFLIDDTSVLLPQSILFYIFVEFKNL